MTGKENEECKFVEVCPWALTICQTPIDELFLVGIQDNIKCTVEMIESYKWAAFYETDLVRKVHQN